MRAQNQLEIKYFSVEIAFNGYLRHLDQKIQDEIIETYLSSCNSSLKFETRQEKIPPVYEFSLELFF